MTSKIYKTDMVEALVEHFYHPIAEDVISRKDWEKHLGKKDRAYLQAKIIEVGIDILEFARIRRQKMTVEKKKKRCDNTGCIGGRAFQIRDKLFCSPCCGNTHFNLTEGDEDYWPEETETSDEEEEECCQTYYKCMCCHAVNNDFDGLDCPECENENCIETVQMTETELEKLLEKLNP